jgi:Ca2+-binding RTX toxin-like protein
MDRSLDDFHAGNSSTPAGYFGSCTTGGNGSCATEPAYAGSEIGTDTIAVWVNSPGETGNDVFAADGDDPQDPGGIQKQWVVAGGGATCIDVDPNNDTNPPTGTHTLVAFVTKGSYNSANDNADTAGQVQNDCGGAAVSGVGVEFNLSSDQTPDTRIVPDDNGGEDTETAVTDANGRTSVTVDNKNDQAGTSSWTNVANVLGTGAESGDTSVTKTWSATADVELDMHSEGTGADDTVPGVTNTQVCNANLSNFGDTTGSDDWDATHTGALNTVELVCVSARDAAGNLMVGATATLSSSGVGTTTDSNGPPPSSATSSAPIATDGYAKFYIHSTTVGTQTVTASVAGVGATDSGTKTYSTPAPAEARIIDCTPKSAGNSPGTVHEIVCQATDGFANAVPGVTVSWSKADSGGASSVFVSQATTTDAGGRARARIRSDTAGTTSVTGSISSSSTECENGAGQPDPADSGKAAGRCADTVTKTWSPAKCPGLEGRPGNHIVGTSGADTIVGTGGNDVICSFGGDDVINAGGGDDYVVAGAGNDRVRGEAGADTIFGQTGADIVYGDAGDDRISGGADADALVGGDGADRLWGVGGNDRIWGFGGNDVIYGNIGNDVIRGGQGADALVGSAGNDSIVGDAGQDQMWGQDGLDRFFARDGEIDRVSGGDGGDVASRDAFDVVFGVP